MSEDGDDIVYAIVEAVAERERVAPADLPPLQTVVDCDALTDLVADSDDGPGEPPMRIQLTYCEYEVEIDRDRQVSVRPLGENRPV